MMYLLCFGGDTVDVHAINRSGFMSFAFTVDCCVAVDDLEDMLGSDIPFLSVAALLVLTKGVLILSVRIRFFVISCLLLIVVKIFSFSVVFIEVSKSLLILVEGIIAVVELGPVVTRCVLVFGCFVVVVICTVPSINAAYMPWHWSLLPQFLLAEQEHDSVIPSRKHFNLSLLLCAPGQHA